MPRLSKELPQLQFFKLSYAWKHSLHHKSHRISSDYSKQSLGGRKYNGIQDGPNFILYQISNSGQAVFFIKMDSYDSTFIQELWTNNKNIQDEYGNTVGQKIAAALEKRPTLQLHSDLQHNIYAIEENSKIKYRLTGNFRTLNDSTFFAEDYSLEKWQAEGMEIEYLIWRK